MNLKLKSGPVIAILTLLVTCANAQFIADFELFNDGVIEDSLLHLAVRIENRTGDTMDLNIDWRIATDNGETLKQMQFPYRLA